MARVSMLRRTARLIRPYKNRLNDVAVPSPRPSRPAGDGSFSNSSILAAAISKSCLAFRSLVLDAYSRRRAEKDSALCACSPVSSERCDALRVSAAVLANFKILSLKRRPACLAAATRALAMSASSRKARPRWLPSNASQHALINVLERI